MRFLLHVGRLHIEAGKPEPAPAKPTPVGASYPLGFHVPSKPVRRNGYGYVIDPKIGGKHD